MSSKSVRVFCTLLRWLGFELQLQLAKHWERFELKICLKTSFNNSKEIEIESRLTHVQGPWWWSSGQRACPLLRLSEFESRWSLQFFFKLFEKNENKQKDARMTCF